MPRVENPQDRAERLMRELREANAEAAGLLKDLRATIKDAVVQVADYCHDEVQKALDGYTRQWQGDAAVFVKEALADIERHVQRACQASRKHIDQDWQYALVMSDVFNTAYRELVSKGLIFEPGKPHN